MAMVVEEARYGDRSEHLFFTGMAVACALIVFAGFAPSYYLRSSALPPLSPFVQLHGAVFTAWILLFVTQTSLVAANRTDIHRQVGIVGAVIAVLLVVIGTTMAIDGLRRGLGSIFGMEARQFFSIPLGDILAFTILVTAALALRSQPQAHKRLMLLATITLLPAPIARLAFPFGLGIPFWFLLTDILVLAVLLYDLWSRARVHKAVVYGAVLIVLAKPLLVWASGTSAWLRLADLLR